MIDPKLNEVPVDPKQVGKESTTRTKQTSEDAKSRLQKISHGLSVNDTVASNANLSVGGRGVDTSGTAAGAGAGAGFTKVNASQGTVNEVQPSERGSGTTVLGSSNTQAPAATLPTSEYGDTDITEEAISIRAYESWCERGRPVGSPEIDWDIAERELRNRKTRSAGV